MKIKKFTTFEFELQVADGEKYCITYKKGESENGEDSFLSVVDMGEDGEKTETTLGIPFLKALYEAMTEVDPFGFAFGDLGLDPEKE